LTTRFFRDRDFIQTPEDFLFCVIGPFHPTERVVSYLKYIPSQEGLWQRDNTKLKRVMRKYTISNLLETFNFISKKYPHYLFFSPVYNITMTAVPHNEVKRHYKCEVRLQELLKNSRATDPLQEKVCRLVVLMSELSNVQTDSFGVTGSILLDIHSPEFSDIDLTVYGTRNSYHLKETLKKNYITRDSDIRNFEDRERKQWINRKTKNHPLNLNEAERLFSRKWNIGIFEHTNFSVHPVKLEDETTEKYGDKIYRPSGKITLEAVVADSQDSIFLPGTYRVEEVKVEGSGNPDIREVVTYEDLYCGVADVGEMISVRGKLEHVEDIQTGLEYDRVIVGSTEGRGEEYIVPKK
jgi:predicted nucleotidyltransferase